MALIGPGSYTINVSSSNGQIGSISGTVTAPRLRFYRPSQGTQYQTNSTYYANPDGAEVTTDTSGLPITAGSSYDDFVVCYVNTSNEVMSKTNTPSISPATGNQFANDLYFELLAPQYSATGPYASVIHASAPTLSWSGAATDTRYTGGVYAQTATGYPLSDGTTLGTVTVSPKVSSSGVSSVTATIKSVGALSNVTDHDYSNEYDYTLMSEYKYPEGTHSGLVVGDIYAHTENTGFDLIDANGNVLTDLSGLLNVTNDEPGTIWPYYEIEYDFSSASAQSVLAASSHYGGPVYVKAYVKNSHDNSKLYATAIHFNLYVCTALGAKLEFKDKLADDTYSKAIIKVDAINEASRTIFGNFTAFDAVMTTRNQGDYISSNGINAYVQNVAGSATIGSRVYELHRNGTNGGFSGNADQISYAMRPEFAFNPSSSTAVYSDSQHAYYFQPTGTPAVRDKQLGTVGNINHGFYILYVLETIQDTGTVGPYKGWINYL